MLFKDIIPKIRKRIHDEDKLVYDDEELMDYFNDAQDFIASTLVSLGYEGMIYTVEAILLTKLPANFIKLCGQYPMTINNGGFVPEQNGLIVRYVGYPLPLKTIQDQIDMFDVWIPLLIQATVMFAQNTEEFTLKQDMEMIKTKISGLVAIRGGA